MLSRNMSIIRPRNRTIYLNNSITSLHKQIPSAPNRTYRLRNKRQSHQIIMNISFLRLSFLIDCHLPRPYNMRRYVLHTMTFHCSNRCNRRLTILISTLFQFRTSSIVCQLIASGLVNKSIRRTCQFQNHSSHHCLFVCHGLFRLLMNSLYLCVQHSRRSYHRGGYHCSSFFIRIVSLLVLFFFPCLFFLLYFIPTFRFLLGPPFNGLTMRLFSFGSSMISSHTSDNRNNYT